MEKIATCLMNSAQQILKAGKNIMFDLLIQT